MSPTELMPIAEAFPMAGFKSSQGFLHYCRRDPNAPRLVVMSPRKHFVNRLEFAAWLAARLGESRAA